MTKIIIGQVLILSEPISFYGGIDPETSEIVDTSHPQKGEKISNTILVLPYSTGSTVGAWTLLRLKEASLSPLAIIVQKSDPVLAAGTVIADIPYINSISLDLLTNHKIVEINFKNNTWVLKN